MKIVEKKFVEKKFVRDGSRWVSAQIEDGVCGEWLSLAFEIPDGVEAVWLSLHDKPSVNRHPVGIRKDRWGEEWFEVVFDAIWSWGNDDLDKVLKPFVGKKLYLQCEYMA